MRLTAVEADERASEGRRPACIILRCLNKKANHMDEKLFKKLLRERKEKDWFDFKASLRLYQSDGKLVEKQRDELLKDILGLANGNSHIIRKTKYLIVGADNEKFDEKGMRVLHNVDYKIPEQSELVKWLNSVASPALVGLESELVPFQGCNLWVITIPPTFELHESTREINASGHFQKHVVFMRQDEHTVPASVMDGITIRERKHLYRREIANPPSIWIGAFAGGVVGLITAGSKIKAEQIDLSISENLFQIMFTGLGIFFGASIGYIVKQFNEILYDWRYLTFRQRVILIFLGLIFIAIYLLIK